MRKSVEPLHWLVYQLAAAGASKKAVAEFLCINRKTVDMILDPSKRALAQETAKRSHQKNRSSRLQKQKEYREKNLEREKARVRRYHAENASAVKEAARNWRSSNREYLRNQAKKYYSGEALHASLNGQDAIQIRELYERGVETQEIALMYGVGVKAVAGAVRYAGGAIGAKTRRIALSDTLLGFCEGRRCRPHREPVIAYLNATAVDGLFKAGITKESWSSRSSKNRCGGQVYGQLHRTWALPSRFHGWCVEVCWASMRGPSSAQIDQLGRLPGWSEVRAGSLKAFEAALDSWCASFAMQPDSLESRYRCARLALSVGACSPTLRRHLSSATESLAAFETWHSAAAAMQEASPCLR